MLARATSHKRACSFGTSPTDPLDRIRYLTSRAPAALSQKLYRKLVSTIREVDKVRGKDFAEGSGADRLKASQSFVGLSSAQTISLSFRA
jgi:hypothetical protein